MSAERVFYFCPARVAFRGDVREIREDTVHAKLTELFELRLGLAVVSSRQEFLVHTDRPDVHQEAGRMRARDQVGRRAERTVGIDRDDEPLLRPDAVGVGGDVFNPSPSTIAAALTSWIRRTFVFFRSSRRFPARTTG